MRLYLIGMPGCGKSSLGKKLALKLNYQFIDMDEYIEQKACMFIDEIFEAYGEEWFRAFERNVLKEFQELDNVIIATGGGVIKNKDNKALMDGKCIYLMVELEEIKKRLESSGIVRPLLKEKTVEQLFFERKELYDYFADIRVDNTNIDEAISNIIEGIKNEKCFNN
ncbi:MAG: shikimate kinase [Acholeplasmatales bacterium]|nr:shikimate kinase [Acholeplasmatales bacterium]